MKTFQDIINRWPSATVMAADVGESRQVVEKWLERDSIPGSQWRDVAEAGQRRKLKGVTILLLTTIGRKPKK